MAARKHRDRNAGGGQGVLDFTSRGEMLAEIPAGLSQAAEVEDTLDSGFFRQPRRSSRPVHDPAWRSRRRPRASSAPGSTQRRSLAAARSTHRGHRRLPPRSPRSGEKPRSWLRAFVDCVPDTGRGIPPRAVWERVGRRCSPSRRRQRRFGRRQRKHAGSLNRSYRSLWIGGPGCQARLLCKFCFESLRVRISRSEMDHFIQIIHSCAILTR